MAVAVLPAGGLKGLKRVMGNVLSKCSIHSFFMAITVLGETEQGRKLKGVAVDVSDVVAAEATDHRVRRPGDATWMASRISRTSDLLDQAFAENLTGHVFVRRDGKAVELTDGTKAVEFVSCSYLGLEQHPALVDAAREALDGYGVHFSSSRNRMQPPYLGQLESILAEIYGSPVVCFTSVSGVHLGILPLLGADGLPGYPLAAGGPLFLVERTAHSSMQVLRGIMEQFGPVSRFDAADQDGLRDRLRSAARSNRTPIVLIDGVGSMGGLTHIAELRDLLSGFGGYLYVDDAHGMSIAGPRGAGYAHTVLGGDLAPTVILVCSLSKAFGGSGAFVVLPGQADVKIVRKLANPLVFGHSIMLPMLAADVAAARLHLSGEVGALQARLWERAEQFDRLTGHSLVNAGQRSPVRGAHFDDEQVAFDAARRLREAGVLVLPAFFPTVAKGSGLMRFAISSAHEPDHLLRAARALGMTGAPRAD